MKSLRLSMLLFLATTVSSAQDFPGYGHSNYAGITGAAWNPASLADNRYSLDIQLIGGSLELANNYAGIRPSQLRTGSLTSNDLVLRNRPFRKSVFFRNQILLPGVMFSNDKTGWGIDLRIRSYINVDGVEENLAHLLVFGLKDPPQYNIEQHNRHVGFNYMSWGEIAGTYSRVTFKGAGHFVSMGVRPKFLLGLGAAYAYVNDLGYMYHNDSTLTIYDASAKFGHSSNFRFAGGGFGMSYKVGFNPGLALDAGIVYENRPEELQPHNKNKKKSWPGFRDRPEYQYRIGAAITDLGFIYFNHGEFSDEYTVQANLWDTNDDVFDTTAPQPVAATFDVRSGGGKEGSPFIMRTPLALDLQFDYRLAPNVYVNATSYTGLYLRNVNFKRVNELTRISVTPRWETRWLGVWMPLSFTRMGTLSVGSGVRLGPLVLGTTDILFYLLKNKPAYNADIYFVLKVPLFPLGKGGGKKGKTKGGSDVDECAD